LNAEHAEDPIARASARGENGTRGHAILGTYRHETPHPMTTAPIVLPIVVGTDPKFMIKEANWRVGEEKTWDKVDRKRLQEEPGVVER